MLEINLLGQFDVRLNGEPADLKSRPAQLLLAYLILNAGQRIRRERLAGLFWPDSTESTARKNLRHVLWRLRQTIGQEYLATDKSTVTFNGEAPYQLDVDVLKSDAGDEVEALIESVSVYKGILLPGFYEDWVLRERERTRTLFERRMQALLGRLEETARWPELVNWSEHWLAFGQTPEPAYRSLMTGYAGLGDLARVTTSYRRCVQALDEELGVEPSAETQSLFERLSRGEQPVRAGLIPSLDKAKLSQRFVAEELLTVGGQGEVYRGRDQSTGEAVVIKRLRSDLAVRRPELIDRLKQEGSALRQLNHPNIVAMLAMVEEESQISLVMEYVPGGSLRQHLDQRPQLPLDQALDISLELADALSRAHHLNIVHRDLKPGNVLLAADGTPRLTDFGLALLQDTDARLTQSGVAIGSPSYMSPEALQGEKLDSTSDIWSFGVLLYEMLAGQRPFGGEQIAIVLAGILTNPVPDIRRIRSDLPPDLIHLLDRLLVKDPQERLASMRQVAAQLEAIRSGRDSEFVPHVQAKSASFEPRPTRPGWRYNLLLPSTPFVGRSHEWKRLRTAAEVALRGQAHCLCILGEAGIGKTRLAEELISWAQHQGILTARTRSYEAQGSLAFAAIAQLFHQDELSGKLGELSDTWLVEIARLIPELTEGKPDLPAPAPLAEGWQKRRFFEALARGISGENRPVLLVFDDLQWLDQETLEWLHFLLRFDPQARLLVVGTFRDDEVDAEHPLTKLRRDLQRDDLLTDIRLFPLNKDDSVSLAEKISGNKIKPEERESLYHDTEGNPLFIVETIRARQFEGEVDTSFGGNDTTTITQPGESAVLPPKIQSLVQGRLDRLSPDARDLVKVAATIGRSFEYQVLLTASPMPEGKLTEILDELWERRIIREQEANIYDFSHDKIREVASTQISSAQKRRLNQRIAQALEIVYADRLDEIAGEIAVHFEKAGLFEEAIAYYQRAARVDQERGAYQNMVFYLESGIGCLKKLPSSPERYQQELAMQLTLGPALMQTRGAGDPVVESAFARAERLCEIIGKDPELFQALYGLAQYYMNRADLQKMLEYGWQCLELARQTQDLGQLMVAHLTIGVARFFLGILPRQESIWNRFAIAIMTPSSISPLA